MSQYIADIRKVRNNGPFMYIIMKDGAGEKAAINIANLGAAFNGARDDIAGLLAQGEQVERVLMQVQSTES